MVKDDFLLPNCWRSMRLTVAASAQSKTEYSHIRLGDMVITTGRSSLRDIRLLYLGTWGRQVVFLSKGYFKKVLMIEQKDLTSSKKNSRTVLI